jgi:anion-transporting  ArsA/GET3 family ATPase
MLIEDFFSPRILVIAGKGGVGKTTVSAALALVAARRGRKVCVAEIDRKGTLPRLFGGEALGYQPSELSPGVWGMNVVVEEALAEYLKVQYHLNRISRMFTSPQFLDYITTAAPGLRDILVLGKVWYLEQGRSAGGPVHDFDTIIVDAQASGHMLTFLSAPMGLADAVQVGPLRRQSEWIIDMLRDRERTRVHMVTLAEEMPVEETIETSEALRARIGLVPGAAFANAIYTSNHYSEGSLERLDPAEVDPNVLKTEAKAAGVRLEDEDITALIGYARFFKARSVIQRRHLARLRRHIEEPVIELPFLFSAGLALPDIEGLADEIESKVTGL